MTHHSLSFYSRKLVGHPFGVQVLYNVFHIRFFKYQISISSIIFQVNIKLIRFCHHFCFKDQVR